MNFFRFKKPVLPQSQRQVPASPFRSFLMGGFESASQRNSRDERIDMIAGSQHDLQVSSDYALLRGQGLLTIRDGTRWHLIEKQPGVYDFSSLAPMVDAALKNDVQIIWNLMHYGVPDGLDIFSEEFPLRFARYCQAVAQFIDDRHRKAGKTDVPVYAPVNEISFMAWAGSDVRVMHPKAPGRGHDIKRQLVRAAIKGMDAVWQVDPRARFVHVDPFVNVMPPLGEYHHTQAAADYHDIQYETWDMIAGRKAPELGGHMRYLDIIGVNFYHDNQWEHPGGRHLDWATRPRDDRWKRFSDLAPALYHRYGRPFMLSETGHIGVGRGDWLQEITLDILMLRAKNIPIEGVCLYPIIDRTGWDNEHHWHNSGLWDFENENGILKRVLVKDYARQVQMSRSLFDHYVTKSSSIPSSFQCKRE